MSHAVEHEERPGLWPARARRRPRAGVGILVAETVSRLAGDAVILAAIRKALPKGSRLTTASETGNADHDEDREDFEALFSKREIKQIRQRTRGAMAVKKMRGEVVGCLPYGFRRKADGAHVTRDDGAPKCAPGCHGCLHIERDPAEQAVIAGATALRADGLSVAAVERQLRAEGVVGRVGKPLLYAGLSHAVRSGARRRGVGAGMKREAVARPLLATE